MKMILMLFCLSVLAACSSLDSNPLNTETKVNPWANYHGDYNHLGYISEWQSRDLLPVDYNAVGEIEKNR